eukprot:GHVU01035674.1.p1 GENE.GHVU01035674.1~~GHVU01035674.1.p1  ORF type:complete len:128 (+),score=0.34 GHVU01035674.1:255-638(+)
MYRQWLTVVHSCPYISEHMCPPQGSFTHSCRFHRFVNGLAQIRTPTLHFKAAIFRPCACHNAHSVNSVTQLSHSTQSLNSVTQLSHTVNAHSVNALAQSADWLPGIHRLESYVHVASTGVQAACMCG